MSRQLLQGPLHTAHKLWQGRSAPLATLASRSESVPAWHMGACAQERGQLPGADGTAVGLRAELTELQQDVRANLMGYTRPASARAASTLQPALLPQRRAAAAGLAACPAKLHARGIAASTAVMQQPLRQDQAFEQSASSEVQSAGHGPWAQYQAGLREERIRHDIRQEVAMKLLQRLFVELQALYPHPRKRSGSNLTTFENVAPAEAPKRSWWSAMTRQTPRGHEQQSQSAGHSDVKGVYLWGGVGCGKTMLMDIFVDSAPKQFYVKRMHFHDFMLEIHTQLRSLSGEQDPLTRVADKVASQTRVICMDELFVTDVADAMILARLFARLFDRGVTLVATSNRHPEALYENGLQRPQFVPFITRVQQECEVHDMDSATDYRTLATRTLGSYFVRMRDGQTKDERLTSALDTLLEGQEMAPTDVAVAMERTLHAARAAGAIACFTFDELCGANVGASDYIAVVERFHTIALKGVPIFTAANRNTAYRFVKLIDLAYEHRVRMLISAEGYIEQLFANILTVRQNAQREQSSDELVVDDNLGFAKDRIISRLTEMQTLEYAIAHARMRDPSMVSALEEALRKQRKA